MNAREPDCVWNGPPGLRDPEASARLTFNWLGAPPPPLPAAAPPEPDERIARWALFAQCAAFVMILAVIVGVPVFFMVNPPIWAGMIVVAAVIALGAYGGHLSQKSRQAQKTFALWRTLKARAEAFAPIQAWREARATPEFWAALGAKGDGAAFEIECAEILAAILQTDQIALTRKTDDYGADIMACADDGLVVAQCKLSAKSPPKIGHIRELAGSKSFFKAQQGLFFSLAKIGEERVQAGAYAQTCNLQYWDAEALRLLAAHIVKTGSRPH
jgi:hypothetical protein